MAFEKLDTIPPWKTKKRLVKRVCNYCGKDEQIPYSSRKRKFCSLICYYKSFEFRILSKSSNWQGGKSFEPYSITWNTQLKLRVRVRDNFICQECGIPELETGRALDVHHIDYNKKNCLELNLISLCVNCHRQTLGNKEYWKEHFQSKMGEKII